MAISQNECPRYRVLIACLLAMSCILSVLTGPLLDTSNLFHGKIRESGADGLIGMLRANAVISLTMVEKKSEQASIQPLEEHSR